MMVIDASVWASYMMPDDANHSTSQNWVKGYLRNSGELTEPFLMLVEVGGAVARRTRDTVRARRAVDTLLQLPVVHWVIMDQALGMLAAQVAVDLHLRGADAVYVAVARQHHIPLITWDDEQLKRAANYITVRMPTI